MKASWVACLVLIAGCATEAPASNAEAARLRRQLDELYKPLVAMVEESRLSVQAFMKQEGRTQVLPSDRPPTEEELKRWIAKAEGDLMPRNDRMCELIRAKGSLVEGGALPPSWQALLEHEDGWRADHTRWKKDGVEYPFHARTPFPRLLEKELRADIQKLESRLAELTPKP